VAVTGKVYKSSPQALVAVLAGGGSIAAILFNVSRWGNRVVPAEMNEPILRMLAYVAPLVVACALVLLVLYLGYAGSGKQVRLSGEGLNYSHHGRVTVIPWDLMVLIKPPANSSNFLGSAMVSDGRRFVRLEKVLYPEFDSMLAAIDEKRRARQGSKKARL